MNKVELRCSWHHDCADPDCKERCQRAVKLHFLLCSHHLQVLFDRRMKITRYTAV